MRITSSNQTPGAEAAPGRCLPIIADRIARQIPVPLIVRIEACDTGSLVFTRDGRSYPVAKGLVRIGRLVNSFWRVHRSHLINPAYIKTAFGLIRHSRKLAMTTGECVPVARRRKEAIYQQLKQLHP